MTEENLSRQKMRYSDDELSLISSVFKKNDELLILFRRFLLQDKLSEKDWTLLRPISDNPSVIAVLKKTFNPEVDKGAPLNQTVDLFSGMDLQPTEIGHAILAIVARTKVKMFLDQRFEELQGGIVENPIIFDNLVNPEGKSNEQAYTDFVARTFLLGYIDTQGLRQLQILSNMQETADEMVAKLRKNSNK